jgi:hypothetical protein
MLSSDVKRTSQLPYDILVKIFVLVGPKTYLPDNFFGRPSDICTDKRYP